MIGLRDSPRLSTAGRCAECRTSWFEDLDIAMKLQLKVWRAPQNRNAMVPSVLMRLMLGRLTYRYGVSTTAEACPGAPKRLNKEFSSAFTARTL